jgi:predicted aspartyl protease
MAKKTYTLMQPSVTVRGDKGEEHVQALVDTGASFSFIRQSLAERVSTVVPLPTPVTFTLGDARTLTIRDTCVVACVVDGMTLTDHMMVLPDAQAIDALILGAATLRKYGIKIDVARNEMFTLMAEDSAIRNPQSAITTEEVPMTEGLKTLMTKLSLPMTDDMTDEQAVEQIVRSVQGQQSAARLVASPAILALLECAPTATEAEVKGKLMALKHPGNVVPAEQLTALQAQLHARDITDTVEGGLRDGKLTPAEKIWASGEATKDLPAFKAFLAARPQVVPLGVVLPKAEPKSAAAQIDDVQARINAQLGLSPEVFAKYAN